LNSKLIELPNIPHVSVPPGKSDADNEFMYEEGVIPELLRRRTTTLGIGI